MSEKSFLLELSEARRTCSNVDYRELILQVADSLRFAIKQLADLPTTERMIDLNCAWAHAKAVLDAVPAEGDPAPVSGAPEPAKLALAA